MMTYHPTKSSSSRPEDRVAGRRAGTQGFKLHGDITEAIAQEKRIKRWRRAWKVALIERNNPQWFDLYETLNQ